ncbi:LysR family transcriptional regulator [Streptomyces synnematoformans]|uniref:LysR family transcriptional regulator n=1 Tax=Streptomyces synnematoformans TaxID=415721 RepID=A0ABN2Z5D9_9ACTN
MNLDHVRTALALARHGTVNRTAAAEGLAPSSVSDRVRRLEHDLGARLFTRDRRGMHPTPAGRAYLAAAAAAVADLDAAAARLTGPPVAVTVGAQSSIADTLLPAVLDRLADSPAAGHARLRASIRPEADRTRLLTALVRDEADAAVLLDTGPDLGDLGYPAPDAALDFLDLREVPMATVAPPGHPLAGRPVTLADVRSGASLVGQESRCSFWMATRRWLGPDVDLTAVGGLAQVREWVAAGRGVAVLPDFAVRDDLERGRVVALDAATPPLQLRLVWSRSRGTTEPVRTLLYAVSQA